MGGPKTPEDVSSHSTLDAREKSLGLNLVWKGHVSLQFRVLSIGFLQNGNVGVAVPVEGEVFR